MHAVLQLPWGIVQEPAGPAVKAQQMVCGALCGSAVLHLHAGLAAVDVLLRQLG